MKKLLKNSIVLLVLALTLACSKESHEEKPGGSETIELQNEVNDFVWQAMNNWYFWQSTIPNLADGRDDDLNSYHSYLNNYSDPKALFESLLSTEDDFSWFLDDVDERLNATRGISESYGIDFLNAVNYQNKIGWYINYVVPGSPADLAGIKRGDFIYKIDGTLLNENNFQKAYDLYNNPTISLGIATIDNGVFTPKENDIDLTAVLLTENPVHHSSIIEENGKKIGYLVYNGFINTFHAELNTVFSEFKTTGIDELILDLRYNLGGELLTTAFLASMIDGNQPAYETTFAEIRFNEKRNSKNGSIYPFYDELSLYDKTTGSYLEGQNVTINRLSNLNRLIVLTTNWTASASEALINGLRPNLEVVLIGDVTVGKRDGSFTLVDAPASDPEQAWTNVNNRNPDHNMGLQPIVARAYNSLGQSDYANGFQPDVPALEIQNIAGMKPFGDTNDYQLRIALDYISGASSKSEASEKAIQSFKIGEIPAGKTEGGMYFVPGELKHLPIN